MKGPVLQVNAAPSLNAQEQLLKIQSVYPVIFDKEDG